MKFVASVVALLLTFWVAVKLGLLAYHALLHFVIGLAPSFSVQWERLPWDMQSLLGGSSGVRWPHAARLAAAA